MQTYSTASVWIHFWNNLFITDKRRRVCVCVCVNYSLAGIINCFKKEPPGELPKIAELGNNLVAFCPRCCYTFCRCRNALYFRPPPTQTVPLMCRRKKKGFSKGRPIEVNTLGKKKAFEKWQNFYINIIYETVHLVEGISPNLILTRRFKAFNFLIIFSLYYFIQVFPCLRPQTLAF